MTTISPEKMFREAERCVEEAYALLGDAGDWLRSDWPEGTTLTRAQASRRAAMSEAIAAAKRAINESR
jgi:hypothetical protein